VNFYPGFEHRQPAFLKINPLGQLPAIRDGEVVLRDAQAILTYLARKYDPAARWLPNEPVAFAEVMMWLFFTASELSAATAARLHAMLDFPVDAAAVKQAARKAFRIMNDAMTAREHDGASWFVGAGATLADVALFPAIALSRDFGVEQTNTRRSAAGCGACAGSAVSSPCPASPNITERSRQSRTLCRCTSHGAKRGGWGWGTRDTIANECIGWQCDPPLRLC
jgi:glutathione S-transferase